MMHNHPVTFAVQYLEPLLPSEVTPERACSRLREAFSRLPISLVILGWDIPPAIEVACAEEVTRHGAQLFRWQPLLTGLGDTGPPRAQQVIGLNSLPVRGYQDKPEFTFLCPNNPQVKDETLDRLDHVIRRGVYHGIFLDRIRFPSPSVDPASDLTCFCPHCRQAAHREGLDLRHTRIQIRDMLATPAGACRLIREMLSASREGAHFLRLLLDFRQRSVGRFVQMVAEFISARGLTVGLDVFSPSLARMVGQDLTALGANGAWVKIMSYPHALGPAGLPFELLRLADWLIERYGIDERDALSLLAETSGLPIPQNRSILARWGLPPETIYLEAARGRDMGVQRLYIGLALVEIPGINDMDASTLASEVEASQRARPDGLVLSWDLWHIPMERLTALRDAWLGRTI
ncbi:MAG: hypothetical protein J7M34_10250 [Anaerolineae bacterium]|nr:hypothetical protein [Anaerolineae bacterium]